MKRVIVFTINHFNKIVSWIKKTSSRPESIPDLLYEKKVAEIQNSLSKLSSLDSDRKTRINEDVKKMITYYNERTDQIETRRIGLVESSWQTMTLLVAASGLLFALKIPDQILYPILGVFLIKVLCAIAKLVEYNFQSGFKYPFIKSIYSNKWKWFYYANPSIVSINPNPFQTEHENRKNLLPYMDGLHFFLGNYVTETLDKELQDNIQQLYLLQVHNFYKNKFYLRINSYDVWANYASFVLLLAFLGYNFYAWILALLH